MFVAQQASRAFDLHELSGLVLVRFQHLGRIRFLFLLMAVILLVLSRSLTAMLGCGLVLAAMPFWRWTRISDQQRWIACALLALVFSLGIYIGIGHSDFILALVGRDSTLSGRTQLWAALHPAMLKRPVLGYGYGAFWAGLKGETLNVFIQSRWLPTGADNGYVDLYLGLGALGMCAFLSVFAYSFRIAYRYLRSEVGAIGLWPVTYLCFYALRAVSESQLFSTRSLEFLLFTATTTSVALDYRHEMAMRRVPYIKPALDDE